MDDITLKFIMYHEAGPCAVSLLLDQDPHELCIFPKNSNPFYRYYIEEKNKMESMVISYAGILAEWLLIKNQKIEIDYKIIVDQSILDITGAFYKSSIHPDMDDPLYIFDIQKEAYNRAYLILCEHWGLGECIVSELKKYKRLYRDQIVSIYTGYQNSLNN